MGLAVTTGVTSSSSSSLGFFVAVGTTDGVADADGVAEGDGVAVTVGWVAVGEDVGDADGVLV